MKRRFWQFIHDRLERAWHWVYYHKLAGPLPEIAQSNVKYGYRYNVSYINGRGAVVGPDLPEVWKPSPEADAAGVCHTESECEQMYHNLPASLKGPALEMLRVELEPAITDIRLAYGKEPKDWWTGHHFGWGMAVRNLLRQEGFDEDYFGVHNLDDIYVPLVEEALGLRP